MSQVAGVPDMGAVCRPREGLTKGTKASDSTSVQEKAASPALAPVPNNSVLLHMTLVPFKAPPPLWSLDRVTRSKSVWGSFKRSCRGAPAASASLSLSSCWVFQPEVMGISLPGTGTLSLAPSVEQGPLSPQR
uniref:Uncharacterized protein n=1 Tax=Molossus molossus TaxID=27622 RepID=A0A7J8HDL3_MOLMO|nr:hypothetical protein HJG59_011134 [Molossus molossus]